jgi:hypothetical protein
MHVGAMELAVKWLAEAVRRGFSETEAGVVATRTLQALWSRATDWHEDRRYRVSRNNHQKTHSLHSLTVLDTGDTGDAVGAQEASCYYEALQDAGLANRFHSSVMSVGQTQQLKRCNDAAAAWRCLSSFLIPHVCMFIP